jgi:hypothetical protein
MENTPEQIERMAAAFDVDLDEKLSQIELNNLENEVELEDLEPEIEPQNETVTGATEVFVSESAAKEAEKEEIKEKIESEAVKFMSKQEAQQMAKMFVDGYDFATNSGFNLLAKTPTKDWPKEFKFTKEQLKKLEDSVTLVLLHYFKESPFSPLYGMLSILAMMTLPMAWAAFQRRKENIRAEKAEAERDAKAAELERVLDENKAKAAQYEAQIKALEAAAAQRNFESKIAFESNLNQTLENQIKSNGKPVESNLNNLNGSTNLKPIIDLGKAENRHLKEGIKNKVIEMHLSGKFSQKQISDACNIAISATQRFISQYEDLKKAGKLPTDKVKAK